MRPPRPRPGVCHAASVAEGNAESTSRITAISKHNVRLLPANPTLCLEIAWEAKAQQQSVEISTLKKELDVKNRVFEKLCVS